MFRKPRENSSLSLETPIKPSTGRAPTPPNGAPAEWKPSPTMASRKSSTNPLTPRPNPKTQVPIIGRQGTKKVAYSKAGGKANGSILNFFKKVDSPSKDDGTLFLSQDGSFALRDDSDRTRTPSPDIFGEEEGENIYSKFDGLEDRYNESMRSVKRRKFRVSSETEALASQDINSGDLRSASAGGWGSMENGHGPEAETSISGGCTPPPPAKVRITKSKPRKIGGFLDDSESEDEVAESKDGELKNSLCLEVTYEGGNPGYNSLTQQLEKTDGAAKRQSDDEDEIRIRVPVVSATKPIVPGPGDDVPSLKKESTSFDYSEGFDDLEDFLEDDEFADGEEFLERKWMAEQARLEAVENGFADGYPGDGFADDGLEPGIPQEKATFCCPICEGKLDGLTNDQTSKHVNACLDGNPIPIPTIMKVDAGKTKMMPPGAGSRFSRAAIARPGQASPFEFGSTDVAPSSAFSKLMSSHAEDVAWANAAAAEQAARGKPAYQRTCPFYKIMPGFYICVDAFRYGAVQGCNAYFLSHFHSDHYVGLTSSWCHGPIYCSKVTANLVKQQLRVDPKWVIALEFEVEVEVPGTQSVAVTIIPANHCPGSSLFLFEKVVGKGSNPKVQRVLHCGDFRACPAHIAHPLLMPDIVDSITGRTKQQKIDVCYLDTTYLNPRYAFPSQEDVIKACADMCVSLKKEKAEESDAWEVVKKERAGIGMAKFIGATIKSEDSMAMEVGSIKPRGRLLVICGTYSIGKERICMGIARALDCKIWAPPGKQRICAALEDPELMSRMTDNPREAQIHMQMLMEIRAETLQDYLNGYKPHFSRVVGFRPSGWNYRPPNSR
jgi:DNA cross-link repair 1A protein